MGDGIKKDWRDRATDIAKRKKAVRNRRSRLGEKLMITATVLSALATAGTGAIALMQYRTMERSLNAPNKNESFQDLLQALSETCVAASPLRAWLLSRLIVNSPKPSDQDIEALRVPFLKLGAAFDRYMLWVDPDDRSYLRSIEYAVRYPFSKLQMDSLKIFGNSGEETAADNVYRITHVCSTASNQMISWFHEGRELEVGPYLSAKAPTSISDQ